MKTPGSQRRKVGTNPQRHNRIEKEKYATPRQSLKSKLQDIVLGREEKNRVMKHMGMQAIEHGRVPCDWSNKQ